MKFLKDMKKDIKPTMPDQRLIEFKDIRAFYYDADKSVLKVNTRLMAYDSKRATILENLVNEVLTKDEAESITSLGELGRILTGKVDRIILELKELNETMKASKNGEVYLTIKQKERNFERIRDLGEKYTKMVRILEIVSTITQAELQIVKRIPTIHRLKMIPLEPPTETEPPPKEGEEYTY